MIINSNINPESDCNGIIGNAVFVQNVVNPQLGISSIGVLTNCSCSITSFLSSDITSRYYVNIASLILSGETQFTIYLNQPAITVALFDLTTLTDSIGLVCASTSANQHLTYCGPREFVIKDNKLNAVHNLTGSTLFNLDINTNTLSIATSLASNVGVHSFTIYVQLQNYSTAGYFPQSVTFTLEVVDSTTKYNVLLYRPTQLFINNSPSLSTQTQSPNDGFVTYYEENNFSTYLDVLYANQQRQFNMGQIKTVYSVYIALRDQYAIKNNQILNSPLGTKIIVGNDSSSSSTISNALCNVISGSTFPRSQWISCNSPVTGQYLWVVSLSNGQTQFSEILAYQYYFIQLNSILKVTASTNQNDIMQPFQQQNPLVSYQSIVNITAPGGFNNYCYLSNNESLPTINIQLKAYANIIALIYLPLLQNTILANSSLFSNGVTIQVYTKDGWVSCPMIVNSNFQPESDCGGISANQIMIQRNCKSTNCQLGLCSLGILSDCDCSKSQFTQSMMDSKFYFNTNNFIISNTTNFIIQLGDPFITLDLIDIHQFTDTTSLVCGDGTGLTFCGPRTISLWEIQSNNEVNVTNSTLISLDSTLLQISIGTKYPTDIGHHQFLLKVSLQNYPSIGYFPQQTLLTVDVQCKSYDLIPVANQTTFFYTVGSGNQTYTVANYLFTPEYCSKNMTGIQAYLQSNTVDVPLIIVINVSKLKFIFNATNPSLAGSSATYLVNATFGTISNFGSTFMIQFQQADDLAPYLIAPLQMPQNFPCFDKISALQQWSYVFPQAKDPQQKLIKFNFICPTLLEFFNQTLQYDVLTLRFKNSSELDFKQISKGVENCQLSISNGAQKASFSICFNITCIQSEQSVASGEKNNSMGTLFANNNSTQNIVAPYPTIELISNRGLMIVLWNVDMNNYTFSFKNITFNQTIQPQRFLQEYNTTNPIQFQVQPGLLDANLTQLQIHAYKIIYYQGNTLQVQLYFNDPGYISAIKKDYLKVIFNPEYFISKNNNVQLYLNQSILLKKARKQIAPGSFTINLGDTSIGLLTTFATCTFLSMPLFKFLANYILSIIDPLIIITHYILIDLNYPANLQDFFSQIFPLIQYDIFQSSYLNQIIFSLDQINDRALSDNYDDVGYSYILAVNNIGSLLILINIQLITVALLLLLKQLLKSKENKIAKIFKKFVQLKLESLLWNEIIEFYFGSYLVLSIIGWISIYDIRLGSQFTATENFSSLLGISLVIFSIIFPVILSVIYKKGFKPFQQNLEELFKQKNRTQIIDDFLNKHGSLENYYNKTQTFEDRMKFMQKYGGLFDELRTNRIGGINETIGFPLLRLLSQIFVIIAVLGFMKIPVLALYGVMYVLLPQICYLLCYKPYKEKLDHYRDLFNLTAKLFLTFMLILFTNYVDISVSISGGSQFLVVVLLIIGVNIIVYPLKTIFVVMKYLKRFYKRCKMQIQKRNQDKKIQKEKALQYRRQVTIIQLKEKRDKFIMKIDEESSDLEKRFPQQSLSNSMNKNVEQDEPKQPKATKELKFINLKPHQLKDLGNKPQSTQILPTKTTQQHLFDSIQHQTNKFVEISEEFSSDHLIKSRSNFSIYSSLEEIKLDQSNSKEQELINSKVKQPTLIERNWKNKNKIDQSIVQKGMTDVSRWQRHWDCAFEPTSQNEKVNKLEGDAYIQYLQTRMVILQWDKPPKFTNQNLSKKCNDAYIKRIKELKKQQKNISVIIDQTEQLRNLVAQSLYNSPFIDDLESRKELSKEISIVQEEQYLFQNQQWNRNFD